MPAGTIMKGKRRKQDILRNLDKAFKNPQTVADALTDLKSPMFLADIAEKHKVAEDTRDPKSHYKHLRDDWFGDKDQGGKFWPGVKGEPIAKQVRDSLVELLTRLTELKPPKHAHAYWIEIGDKLNPIECGVWVWVVEGDEDIALIITTPNAP